MKQFLLTPLAVLVVGAAAVFSPLAFRGEQAYAGALPSSKAAVAVGQIIDLEAAALSPDESTTPSSSSTGWRNIMKTAIHTNTNGDLAMDLAMQCALVTDTSVKSMNGTLDVSEAQAGIRFRIAIYPYTSDGSLTGTPAYAEPNNEVVPYPTSLDTRTNRDGVTYCDRYQKLAAKFSGLNCTADLTTGAVTCLDPEELQLILKTLSVHHFNFLYANAVPGVQKVVVQARAQAGMVLGGTALGSASAEAFVGAGALSVETIRLVKGSDGTVDLSLN
jgi:hypothetical protein